MKKFLCVAFAIILTVSAVMLTGCDDKKDNKDTTKSSETSSQSQETTTQNKDNNTDIKSYLDSFIKGDSDFYGAWQIEDFSYMSIILRNDNMAELISGGTEGYFSKYTLDETNKTLKVQLMPQVIDGEYSYSFSKDKQKLTLTLGETSLVLVKQKDFSLLPKAPEKPVIDSDILGWWENEDGMFYCFQDNGIMYENSISMETCYTYTVDDGKIKAVYSSGGEMTEEFTYSIKNGELTLNGVKCTRKDI
ncbi:MAG: hypothetical protein IJ725_03060 [Ruminococcus sp.]|nr:hypothetical protein [Ruminococcus sp.]